MIFSTRFEVGCAFSELRTSDDEGDGLHLGVLTRSEPQKKARKKQHNTDDSDQSEINS
jgi:hypothetical protein